MRSLSRLTSGRSVSRFVRLASVALLCFMQRYFFHIAPLMPIDAKLHFHAVVIIVKIDADYLVELTLIYYSVIPTSVSLL